MKPQGYFGPASITWRLYREPAIALGSARALLLQLAHPAVAEGVARYSNFKADALGRAFRTFSAMATLHFGDTHAADAVAARLNRMHSGIRGEFSDPQSGARAFTANDPDLLLWVLATLVDTTLEVFERVPVKGLPADWRERFFEESKTTAGLLGIPASVYPADLQAFKTYFSNMLNGPLLGSAAVCREQVAAVVQHRYSPGSLAQLMAAGWMPAPLAARLGLSAGPDPAHRLERLIKVLGFLYRLLPRGLRYSPAYHQAMRRIARSQGGREPFLGRWYDYLSQHWRLPLGLPV